MLDAASIAARLGLPEERVALMMQMVKTQGMDEAQMGAMMRTATDAGLEPAEIAETMTSLGLPLDAVLRTLRGEGLADDAQCEQLRARFGARVGATVAVPSAGAATGPDASVADAVAVARRERWVEYAKKAGVIVFWLVVWELLDHLVNNRLLLAGPIRTLQALGEQIVQPDFWAICGASFGRIALGFFLALAVGFGLAMLSYRFKVARRFIDPIISLLKTIPMASFIILLLIWVGTQMLTVYLAFLIVIPIIYTNVLTGFESVSTQMLEMARVHRLSAWRTFAYVYRPAFMPFLHSSCKLSLGMSWKAGIMAEVLAVPAMSIGKEMYTARTFLDTPDLLAWTVVVMVLSLIFEKLVLWALGRAARPCGGLLGSRRDAPEREGEEQLPATCVPAQDLVFEGIGKAFGANQVLADVSFAVPAGTACCLMAPSGSGKTTLFRVMLGLEPADAGSVAGVAPGAVSMTFQEDRLCEALSAVENVLLTLPRRATRAPVRALLAEILPEECLDQPVRELSGGMRRRVSVARAVAYPGALLVLDEPFTGLDGETRRGVIRFILRHHVGRTLLVATHGEDDARLLGATRLDLSELNGGIAMSTEETKTPTRGWLSEFDYYRITQLPLFQGVPGLTRETLNKLGAHLASYRKGEVVCERGQEFPYLGFVLTGEIESGYHGNNYYQMIGRFHAGDTFAAAFAMRGVPAPVGVRSVKRSEVLFLDAQTLLNSPNDPVICSLLARVTLELTDKTGILLNKVRTLRNPVVVGRVAETLLSLPVDAVGVVCINLNQSELGTYLGSSRSRVSGALAILVNDGLIEVVPGQRSAYRIVDRRGLEYTAFNGQTREAGADADAQPAKTGAESSDGGEAPAEVPSCPVVSADGSVRIDAARTMRAIVGDEPLFESFLQSKGFPFSVDNPVTEVVTFNDVSSMRKLDQQEFIDEYARWKREQA